MKRFLLLLLLLSAAMAATLSLEFRDFSTNEPIEGSVALIITDQATGLSFDTAAATDAQGIANIEVPDSALSIVAHVDRAETPGADYHATVKVNPVQNPSVIVFLEPIGTLRGEVVDEQGNALPGADLKISCLTESPTGATDEFGAFTAMLPVGSCRVLARYQDRTGWADVTITHGGVATTTVTLTQNILNPFTSHPLWWLAGALLIIALEAIAIYTLYKRKPGPKPIKREEGELASVMRTLSDREKSIVQHLFDNDGQSNQARIHKELGIPKTSLIRALQALERKKIIETEKDRKLIKVKLTSWIMLKK